MAKEELRQRYREGQEDQLGALGLVLNALILWNTRYMDAAINHLRSKGVEVKEEDVARLSPLGDSHINVQGRYPFTITDSVLRATLDRYETRMNQRNFSGVKSLSVRLVPMIVGPQEGQLPRGRHDRRRPPGCPASAAPMRWSPPRPTPERRAAGAQMVRVEAGRGEEVESSDTRWASWSANAVPPYSTKSDGTASSSEPQSSGCFRCSSVRRCIRVPCGGCFQHADRRACVGRRVVDNPIRGDRWNRAAAEHEVSLPQVARAGFVLNT